MHQFIIGKNVNINPCSKEERVESSGIQPNKVKWKKSCYWDNITTWKSVWTRKLLTEQQKTLSSSAHFGLFSVQRMEKIIIKVISLCETEKLITHTHTYTMKIVFCQKNHFFFLFVFLPVVLWEIFVFNCVIITFSNKLFKFHRKGNTKTAQLFTKHIKAIRLLSIYSTRRKNNEREIFLALLLMNDWYTELQIHKNRRNSIEWIE